MKATAIVYTSNTGFTAQYAQLLGEKTGLPVYALEQAPKGLQGSVIYLGWLMAGFVKDYKKAARQFEIAAVCGVGLCDTGTMLDTVRKNNAVPDHIPVFTLQGGMELSKLQGPYRFAIRMLTKAVAGKKNPTEDDKRMLYLLQTGGCYVSESNLSAVLEWFVQ